VKASAKKAEHLAASAFEAYQAGDKALALSLADELYKEESQWGDAPTWGNFVHAIRLYAG